MLLGWLNGMTPLPPAELTTGSEASCANSVASSNASERAIPPPTNINARLADDSTSTAVAIADGSAAATSPGWDSSNSTGSLSTIPSGGISMKVGRGRPERICRNASLTAPGASCGRIMDVRHLVMGLARSIWSWISCNPSSALPICARGTWPARSSTGEERAYAVANPDPALYMPTPGTITATPGLPVTRA